MNMLFTLMRKDWRCYRAVVLATLIGGAIPYVIGSVLVLVPDPVQRGPLFQRWIENIVICAMIGALICVAITVAFAGSSIAAERNDRTLDFLTMLPPPRWIVLLSKLLVAIPFLIACTVVHMVVLLPAAYEAVKLSGLGNFSGQFADSLLPAWVLLCATAMVAGIAWMLSAFLKSSAIATTIASAIVVVVATVVGNVSEIERWSNPYVGTVWTLVTLTVAAGTFVGGTIHFVRRVAP